GPSGGLLDADLDCREAIAVAACLLPATGWISGHVRKPRSHWWYTVADPPARASERFEDPVRVAGGPDAPLLELRSTGGRAVVPPSIHESGEAIEWHSFEQPAAVSLHDLHSAIRSVAAAALLVRYWPGKGARQETFLALAGG